MTIDSFCELNLGKGGCVMDETLVTFPTDPIERLRSRIQIAGCLPDQLAEVLAIDPCELVTPPFGLVTRNIPCGTQDVAVGGTPGDTIAKFGEITSVSSGSETTVISHIVSAGKTFRLVGFIATGNIPACFTAYISPTATFLPSERILMGRTAVTQPSIQLNTELVNPSAAAATTIAIRVEHSVASLPTGVSSEFQVTLLGYEI